LQRSVHLMGIIVTIPVVVDKQRWQSTTTRRKFACGTRTELSGRLVVKVLPKYIHMLAGHLVKVSHESQTVTNTACMAKFKGRRSTTELSVTRSPFLLPLFTRRGAYLRCPQLHSPPNRTRSFTTSISVPADRVSESASVVTSLAFG
jgi:hypothetical protein